ncbi:MAG TPA: FAD-binding oxidoreductase [Gallionellaceae bacterium]|nr:FAD-binding oxidoreductase [Gallionellaceae bacterium]
MVTPQEVELTRHSFYEASVKRLPPYLPLAGTITADVCVVGGGYAGFSAALELAERGYSVALLEAQRIGWGASGRNGGQALVGFGFTGQEAIEVQLHVADARRAWNISVEAMQLLHRRIARHKIECEYMPGQLTLAVNARKARALETWVNNLVRDYDYHMQFISPAEVGNWIASERFHAGAYDRQSGHLHPLKYCLGLAAAAHAARVQIFEQSAVTVIRRGDRPTVVTPHGDVTCRYVVLAGNVYLRDYGDRVAPEIASRIMPVGTYIITTEAMEKTRADTLLRQRAAAFDTNLVLDYFRVTADNRLLFGGGESYSTMTPSKLSARMRQRMLAVFPQLADLAVPYVWGGFVDITMNQAPDFGRLGKNIYYLQGFSGHGVALSGMAGKLVAESIAGEAERFELMSRIRHRPFPGGSLLRTPMLVLGMFYYRLRELLG